MAKIEVKSKPLELLWLGVEHMYIIYTNDADETRILRGGPEGSNLIGTTIGDIEIVDVPYKKSDTGVEPPDWDKNNNHTRQTIFTGTDSEMMEKIELARLEMNRINSEGYDYNLPVANALNKNRSDNNNQNSNTVVMALANKMNLQDKVIQFVKDYNLHVPGYDATLEHSSFERDTETYAYATGDALLSILNGITDAMNALKDPLIIDLKNDGLNLSDPNNRYIEPIYFDLNNDGIKEKTGWIIPKYEVINITDGISNGFITNPFYFGDEKQASNNPYSKPVIDSANAINGNFVTIDSRDGINSSFITIIDKPYSNVTYNGIKQLINPVIDDAFLAIDKIMPQNETITESTLIN